MIFFLFHYKKENTGKANQASRYAKTWQIIIIIIIMILAKSEKLAPKKKRQTDKEKKRCLNSSQTLNYRHQFCNVHHTNDTGTPSDSEHEVKASRTSVSSLSSRQFDPLLVDEEDAHTSPEGSLNNRFSHIFHFLNGVKR